MLTVAKAILEVLTVLQELNNTQRLIIVLGNAAVMMAHKSEGSRNKIFQISEADSSFSACGLRAHRVHQDVHPAFFKDIS